jgi:hypothetical protein
LSRTVFEAKAEFLGQTMISISKLRSLEDERFYSVLDVALDIRGELDFGATEIALPIQRKLVRYRILMPAATPSMINRYCDLRLKALKFLESEGYLSEVEDRSGYWDDPGDGDVGMNIRDKAEFYRFVVMLTEEEERREPGNSPAQDLPSAMSRIEQLCDSFHRSAFSLRSRHSKRKGFAIADEYDVQDLLGALLETRFSDIRPEEHTPSQAGKAARVDFLLKDEKVAVETKMTREGLSDGKLGDELIVDIERYRKHPDCRALFCFVYDPEHRLKNPDGLEADLSRKTDGLLVRVRIRPRR